MDEKKHIDTTDVDDNDNNSNDDIIMVASNDDEEYEVPSSFLALCHPATTAAATPSTSSTPLSTYNGLLSSEQWGLVLDWYDRWQRALYNKVHGYGYGDTVTSSTSSLAIHTARVATYSSPVAASHIAHTGNGVDDDSVPPLLPWYDLYANEGGHWPPEFVVVFVCFCLLPFPSNDDILSFDCMID
jgi:hypothetical protein